jgi:hypothetical protein
MVQPKIVNPKSQIQNGLTFAGTFATQIASDRETRVFTQVVISPDEVSASQHLYAVETAIAMSPLYKCSYFWKKC